MGMQKVHKALFSFELSAVYSFPNTTIFTILSGKSQ